VTKCPVAAPQKWLNAVYGWERISINASLLISRRGPSEGPRSTTRVGKRLVSAFDFLPQPPQRCDSRQAEIQFAASLRMDCKDVCPHSADGYCGGSISSYRSAFKITCTTGILHLPNVCPIILDTDGSLPPDSGTDRSGIKFIYHFGGTEHDTIKLSVELGGNMPLLKVLAGEYHRTIDCLLF